MLHRAAVYWAAALGVVVAAGVGAAVWRYQGWLLQGTVPPTLVETTLISGPAAVPKEPAASAAPPSMASSPAPPMNAERPPAVASEAPSKPVEAAGPPVVAPQFDIVRVEPTGEAVIAGRAAPNAKVAVTDQGHVVAEATADETGQFVALPSALAPGEHSLGLTASVNGGPPARSSGVVDVDVAGQTETAAKPGAAARAGASANASPPAAAPSQSAPAGSKSLALAVAPPDGQAAGAPANPAPSEPAPRVAVAAVSVEGSGRLVATGSAPPGALLRLYLNGTFLSNVTTGGDGRWSLTVEHGMKGGAYAIRADEIDRAKGSVIARAEVPFNFPEFMASQAASNSRTRDGAGASAPAQSAPRAAAGPQKMASASASVPPAAAEAASNPTSARSSPSASAPLAASADLSSAASPSAPSVAPSPIAPGQSGAAPQGTATAAATASSAPKTGVAPAAAAGSPAQNRQAALASAASPPASSAPPAGAANVIVRNIDTAKVVRGDSLWRISSIHYGNGVRYRQIYAANASQIRNPRLIYPGQIFVLPQSTEF